MGLKNYSEDFLIEQPAIELFKALNYDHINCYNETFGKAGTLGRETPSDVVLVSRLKESLQKLNPDLPGEAIILAIEKSPETVVHSILLSPIEKSTRC